MTDVARTGAARTLLSAKGVSGNDRLRAFAWIVSRSQARHPREPRFSAQTFRVTQRFWVAQPFSAAVKVAFRKMDLAPTAVFLLLLLTACGYHTAGHAVTLPADVRTIAIPTFINDTETYKIEQRLTSAVVREFTTRTHYHILNTANGAADATLLGTVFSTYTAPLTYDSQTGRVASMQITVSMKVSLTDSRGKVLYQNPAYVFRDQYQISQQLNSFFEEDSPAFERLSQDFARTLVSNILEGF